VRHGRARGRPPGARSQRPYQIRARINVCEIEAAALPAIGSQDTVDEPKRLVERLKAIVVFPLPRATHMRV
jgi:hypothetical protein